MSDVPPCDLHALLGAAADLPPGRLRVLYESQMNAAVRGNDHPRALTLSRAFDALPAAVRRAMYAASPAEDRWIAPPARTRGRSRRSRVRRRRLPGDDPRWRTPLLVGLSVVGAVGFLWWLGVVPALLGRY